MERDDMIMKSQMVIRHAFNVIGNNGPYMKEMVDLDEWRFNIIW
jgi:hypothetical protein